LKILLYYVSHSEVVTTRHHTQHDLQIALYQKIFMKFSVYNH